MATGKGTAPIQLPRRETARAFGRRIEREMRKREAEDYRAALKLWTKRTYRKAYGS